MALHLTLENIHKLYQIDSSTKMEGIVVLRQTNSPDIEIGPKSRLFDGLLLGFLIRGTMKVQLHFLEYEIQAGDIAVLQPQLMIDTQSLSSDAEIVTIGLSLDFMAGFPMMRELVMNDRVRWNPIISPSEEEIVLQQELIVLLEHFYQKKESRKKTEMLQYLVATMMSMITEKYTVLADKSGVTKNRTHELIDEFYVLISKYAQQERSVGFYADKLHLTPQYLSTFLKEHTGKSVLQWVDQIVVLHAKTLLQSTSLSIKEISSELNFGDTSQFCRSFKRVVGVSPRNYRNAK
ncbi:MAG: AraC family transcriptional regulator [Sphingobacterium sp.]|nr:AraC family transcriptional regulator [Sphingobacterium sp.]